jgi:putative endonuclease
VNKSQQGKTGEEEACRFLQSQGYKLLARNYRTRHAEIDIIARDRDCLCFVEVRSKHDCGFGSPEESVDRKKRHRVALAATQYLKDNKLLDAKARFDVVAICAEPAEIKLYKNAFELEEES